MIDFSRKGLVLPDTLVDSLVYRDYMSVSTMAAFEGCVASWAAGKVLPRVEGRPDADAAVRGSIFHEIAECAVNECKMGRGEVAEVTARVLFNKYGKDGQQYYELLSGYVDTWFDLEDVENVQARDVEKKLDHVNIEGVPLVGFVDRLDADGTIVDYKTNKKVKQAYRGFDQYAEQILLYRRALRLLREDVAETGRLLYVSPGVARIIEVTGDDTRAVARLQKAWGAMNRACGERLFPVKPSVLCSWCPLGRACPASSLPRGEQVDMFSDFELFEEEVLSLTPPVHKESEATKELQGKEERIETMFVEAKPWDGLAVGGHVNAADGDTTGLLGFISLGTKSGLGFNECLEGARKIEALVHDVDKAYSLAGSAALRVRIRGLVYGFAERIAFDGTDTWFGQCEKFVRMSLDFALETLAPVSNTGDDTEHDNDWFWN